MLNIFFLIVCITISGIIYNTQIKEKFENESHSTKAIETDIVSVSVFHALERQTDLSPLQTASGFLISRNDHVNLVAVSRDLLDKYPMGSIIQIHHKEINKEYGTYFAVLDKMGKSSTKSIDILIIDHKVDKYHNVSIEKVN